MEMSVATAQISDGNYSVFIDNSTESQDNWTWPYTDYPTIYIITIYHLYPVIIFGRVLHTLWYIIGMVGNIVSLRIWMLPRMKRFNSSALYLVGITICDITYQILHIFYFLKYFWGLAAIGLTGFCQVWNTFYLIPQYLSQLLVLGFTTERSIAIFYPFKGERFSKYQRAPKVVAGLTLFSVFVASPQAYFWHVLPEGFCELRLGADTLTFYTNWSIGSETVLFLIVPFVTLALNILVLRETYKSLSNHKRLAESMNSRNRAHCTKGKNCRPSTKTLLCISFFRIFTQLPVTLTYTIQNWYQFGEVMSLENMPLDPVWKSFLQYWGVRVTIDAIGASHHALSIFIFYYSTKQFRNEIHNTVLVIKNTVLRRPNTSPTVAQNSEMRFTESIYRTASTV